MSDEEKIIVEDGNDDLAEIVDQEEEYKAWLSFARIDFESAKYLNGAPFHPRPLNVICYHCQQAAEKAAKALIVYFGSQGGMPKSHDISFLLNQIRNIIREQKGIEIENDFIMMADSLSKYGTAPRYPNEIDVEEYHVKKALADSETFLKWVDNVIATPSVQHPTEG